MDSESSPTLEYRGRPTAALIPEIVQVDEMF